MPISTSWNWKIMPIVSGSTIVSWQEHKRFADLEQIFDFDQYQDRVLLRECLICSSAIEPKFASSVSRLFSSFVVGAKRKVQDPMEKGIIYLVHFLQEILKQGLAEVRP